MGTRMKKGILKPFRYFSNMFDVDDKEPEMQIGFPTNVKHVAHIGWDGPNMDNNSTGPSWMEEYHSAPLDTASSRSGGDLGGCDFPAATNNPWASQEIMLQGGVGLGADSPFRSELSRAGNPPADSSGPSPRGHQSRRHRYTASNLSSSSHDCGHPSEKDDKKDKPKKGARKNRKKDKDRPCAAGDGPSCEPPAVPKKSTRRKNKGASEGVGATACPTAPVPTPASKDGDEAAQTGKGLEALCFGL